MDGKQAGICSVEQARCSIRFPLRIKSEMNLREHWAARHKRFKNQAMTTCLYLRSSANLLRLVPLPLTVKLCRFGPRMLDDDNLAGGFKAVRDEIAKFLRVNDGDKSKVRFLYDQDKSKNYEISITIESGIAS